MSDRQHRDMEASPSVWPDPALLAVARRDYMYGNYLGAWKTEPDWPKQDNQQRQPYPSDPLNLDDDSLRLLRIHPGEWEDPIHCSLEIDKLQNKPDFDALSYTWGSSEENRHIIIDGGSKLPVTDNAFLALRRFRYTSQDRILWIDAVCIDQSNLPERMQQVSMMGKIYTGARQLLIWLGETPNSSRDVTILGSDDRIPRNGIDDVAMLRALDHIYWFAKPRWWERAWIVQETVLARHALVCFGSFQIPWGVFCWEFLRIDTREKPKRSGEEAYPRRYITEDDYPIRDSMRERFETLARLRVRLLNRGTVGGFHQARVEMFDAACMDSRDKVYSVLSIIDQAESKLLKPDYTQPWVEVFARATFAAISVSKSFNILCLKDDESHGWSGLPSWAVNFSKTRMFEWERFVEIGIVDWNGWDRKGMNRPFQVLLSSDVARLTVQGRVFDRVVTKRTLHEWRPGNYAGPPLLNQLVEAVQNPKITRAYQQYPPPRHPTALLQLGFEPTDDQLVQDLRVGNRTSRFKMTVMEAFGVAFLLWSQAAGAPPSIQERDLFNMNRSEVDIYKYWEYAEATASDPAFITTEIGFIGLAPNSAFLGDGLEVVLFDKCKIPVLLRPRGDSFVFVGFAYIHGIMYDELKSLGQDEGLVERSFTLC